RRLPMAVPTVNQVEATKAWQVSRPGEVTQYGRMLQARDFPDQTHATLSTHLSASFTRTSPEMSLGSSASRRAATVRASRSCSTTLRYIGRDIRSNACITGAAGATVRIGRKPALLISRK